MNKQIERRTNSRAGATDGEIAIVLFMVLFLCCMAGFALCVAAGAQADQKVRQEAVNAGVAEWTIDKDGTKGFKWLSPGKESPSVPGK